MVTVEQQFIPALAIASAVVAHFKKKENTIIRLEFDYLLND
jgi:hypothetical protein